MTIIKTAWQRTANNSHYFGHTLSTCGDALQYINRIVMAEGVNPGAIPRDKGSITPIEKLIHGTAGRKVVYGISTRDSQLFKEPWGKGSGCAEGGGSSCAARHQQMLASIIRLERPVPHGDPSSGALSKPVPFSIRRPPPDAGSGLVVG